jgi:predicted transcriptional regulator
MFFSECREGGGTENEAGMEGTGGKSPRKRGLNAYGRMMRRGRIFARMREGWAYDEIAHEEGLTAERIRQIVSEALQKRKVDDGAVHAKLQLARLERVMQFAAEALARGDLKVGALYLKTLDRLDRYQKLIAATDGYTDADREKLLNKLNQIAERLGYDKILAENKKILAEHEANRERFPGEQVAAQ